MTLRILIAATSVIALAACATTTDTPAPSDTAVTDGPTSITPDTGDKTITDTDTLSIFDLAMQTVETLVEAGNEQKAIDRLTQLIGDPAINRDDMAEILTRRGEIRLSARGYDTWGAIEDFREVTENYTDTDWSAAAASMMETANGKATSINFHLAQPETSRMRKFELLMEQGEHEKAIDLMIAYDLEPKNDLLVAMYQIGYLCEEEALTGRAYSATEPDGTPRRLQFCDFGK